MTKRRGSIPKELAEELIAGRPLPAGMPESVRRVGDVLKAASTEADPSETAAAGASASRLATVARESKSRFTLRTGSPHVPLRYKVSNVALGVIIGSLVGGGAFAVAQTVDKGHGGPKPRFHDAKVCNLVDVSTLPGNWTHGDYVSAVEKKDPSKVSEAARSDCGKPSHAGGKGKNNDNKGGAEKGKGGEKKEAEKGSPGSSAPKASPSASPKATVTPTPSPSAEPTEAPSVETPAPSSSATASESSQSL